MTDRELDAQVAERVMDCEPLYDKGIGENVWVPRSFVGYRGDYWTGWREGVLIPEPYYCTTGDGMLAVVEEMEKRGKRLHIAGPFLLFWPEEGHIVEQRYAGVADLPRAVSLAALKAVGVEVAKEVH